MENICAIIPTWKRVEITVETVRRLIKQTVPISRIVVVGSEEKDMDVTIDVDVDYIEAPNIPLGAKMQAGVDYCKQFEPEALLICGSDDWLSLNWVKVLSPYLKDYDLIGSNCLYVITADGSEFKIGRASYEGSLRADEPMGPGRLISKRILDKMDWQLYPPDIRSSLDKHSFKRMMDVGCKVFVEKEGETKILCPKGKWKTINTWDNYIAHHRIKNMIHHPKRWLKYNFPDAIESLRKIDLVTSDFPSESEEVLSPPKPSLKESLNPLLNIVMLSDWDFGASGWQIVQAIKRHTSHNIIHVRQYVHKSQFPSGYTLGNTNRREIRQALDKADIVHFKGDKLPLRHWANFRIPKETKIICTVAGTGFRRFQKGLPDSMAKEWFTFNNYIAHSDFRTALTPDLNYPQLKGIYTQGIIDSESSPYCWRDKDLPVIGYFPAFKNRKGYDSHIRPALDQLKKEGYKFEELPTVGVSYRESVALKRKMTIFIDQITWVGGYGNSAIEAMQFGIPVIAYLSDKTLKQSNSEEFCNSPILNPGFTVEGLMGMLKKILSRDLDLEVVSLETKRYCDTFHSYSRGAKMWDEIYRKVAGQ